MTEQELISKFYEDIHSKPDYDIQSDGYGNKHWYFNRKRHREDGPAIEYASGRKCWFINGERHRTDGPAVELANGMKQWYINGEELTEEEFYFRARIIE